MTILTIYSQFPTGIWRSDRILRSGGVCYGIPYIPTISVIPSHPILATPCPFLLTYPDSHFTYLNTHGMLDQSIFSNM